MNEKWPLEGSDGWTPLVTEILMRKETLKFRTYCWDESVVGLIWQGLAMIQVVEKVSRYAFGHDFVNYTVQCSS
jgi:hypothetical protein